MSVSNIPAALMGRNRTSVRFGSFAKISDPLSISKIKALLCKPYAHLVTLVPIGLKASHLANFQEHNMQ